MPDLNVLTRYDCDRDQLAALLDDQPTYRVDQAWHGLYQLRCEPDDMTSLPMALREQLTRQLPLALAVAARSTSDEGATIKWLWTCGDGSQIETVLMHYDDRSTVCVSTQSGCAMGCRFCATGQAGYGRNLSVGEIVEQVIHAQQQAGADHRRVSNVVFMGMGEPLANFDQLDAAVRRLHGDLGLSARHLTISTVGLVPGIDRLAHSDLPVNLAVSLHAANDTLRDELVPINRRYPLATLEAACVRYLDAKGRRLSFEWALIDGVNDQPRDAAELADIAYRLRAHVNLIPLNPTPGYLTQGTPRRGVVDFRDALRERGVRATVRQNRGTDIDAACGQLRATAEAAPVALRRSRPT